VRERLVRGRHLAVRERPELAHKYVPVLRDRGILLATSTNAVWTLHLFLFLLPSFLLLLLLFLFLLFLLLLLLLLLLLFLFLFLLLLLLLLLRVYELTSSYEWRALSEALPVVHERQFGFDHVFETGQAAVVFARPGFVVLLLIAVTHVILVAW
jgi:hypothetical protein